MPWKDLAVSEQRKAFVDECLAQKRSKFELCAAYGISRPTGDKWLARFKERGKPGLQDQSRAPHRRPNAMDSKTEKQLLEGKERYPKWGARKIREALLLQDRTLQLPSPMAIHQLFARRGLVQERQQRRARPAHYQTDVGYAGPNALWCMDFKGDMKTPRNPIAPFTCTDGFSRFLLLLEVLRRNDERCTHKALDALFCKYGTPDAMRSDNGPPFASVGLAGLSVLAIWLIRLGIVPVRGRPGCPQDNGRHERMHGSLERELADELCLAANPSKCLDGFRGRFNHERPHESIANKTPAMVYVASTKVYPRPLRDPEYPSELFVERIDKRGKLFWMGHSHLLTPLLAGQLVGIRIEEPTASAALRFGPLPLGHIRNVRRTADHPRLQPRFEPRT